MLRLFFFLLDSIVLFLWLFEEGGEGDLWLLLRRDSGFFFFLAEEEEDEERLTFRMGDLVVVLVGVLLVSLEVALDVGSSSSLLGIMCLSSDSKMRLDLADNLGCCCCFGA